MLLAVTNPLPWAAVSDHTAEPCRLHGSSFSSVGVAGPAFKSEEVCGISHLSQNFTSFGAELLGPLKATYPSGRTRTIEGEEPKYFSNLSWPGTAAIRWPRIIRCQGPIARCISECVLAGSGILQYRSVKHAGLQRLKIVAGRNCCSLEPSRCSRVTGKSGKRSPARSSPECPLEPDNGLSR